MYETPPITPSDSFTNPTNVGYKVALGKMWDATLTKWRRLTGDANGLIVQMPAASVGGWQVYRNAVAGTIIGVLGAGATVKLTPGVVGGWQFFNSGIVTCHIQLYNVLQAGVTFGTTIPIKTITVLPGATIVDSLACPLAFSVAISCYSSLNYDGSGGAPATLPTGSVDFI